MERDLGSIGILWITITGFVSVVVGLWLPWLVVEPGYTGVVPPIELPETEAGIEGIDYLILGVVVGGLFASKRVRAIRTRARLIVATGSITLLSVAWYLTETTGLDGTYLGVFVAGRGVTLTLFGGGLLLVAGILQYVLDGATDYTGILGTNSD